MFSDLIVWLSIGLVGGVVANLRLIYFIQLKEYRLDRTIDFLKYDKGIRTIFKPLLVVSYLLLFAGFINPEITTFALTLFVLSQFVNGFMHGFFRFKKTVKALSIFITTIFGFYLLAILSSVALALILNPVVLFAATILFNFVFNIQKNRIMKQAANKIASYPDLKIIGVTGSYGKSSVKDFIAKILDSEFKVVSTPENINSDIGIAQFILKNDFSSIQYFIVEMGAYRISEIARICQITHPDFAVITAIGEEHVSLFGSIQNIETAKSEIFSNAKDGAQFFVNADNEGCQNIVKNLKVEATTFGQNSKANFKCEKIRTNATTGFVEFEYNSAKISTKISGEHQAANLMAAIAVASKVGVKAEKILKVIPTIKTRSQTLTLKTGLNGCKVFDDSYNSNPAGFLSAIKTCKNYKANRKILITMGMMELGDLQDQSHELVATEAVKVFDHIIITRTEIFSFFNEKSILIESSSDILKELKNIKLTESDLVLIQNRLPMPVYDFILKS